MKNQFLGIVTLFVAFAFSYQLQAQESTKLQAGNVENIESYKNGSILTSSNFKMTGNISLANESNSEFIFGVYYKDPNFKPNPYTAKNPFITSGICDINCNSSNGVIKKGDPITSSAISGEGMKATKPGMIVGVALEDAVNGKVKTRILIQYLK